MGALFLCLIAVFTAMPVAARDPILRLPVNCILGDTCYIQQYVDRQPGPGVLDVGCGTLANEGHKGTDFAVPDLAMMRQGVAVLAAAPGTVRGTRDGMPDIVAGSPGAPDLTGRECGNGLVVDHGGGWETQYCHLRKGSLAVATGERIAAGTPLGLVGLSGLATFPHVHFAVRKHGDVVDPFQPDATASCGSNNANPLWDVRLDYEPAGIIRTGLAGFVPDFEAVKVGLPSDGLVGTDAPMVSWASVFGGRIGDILRIRIDGPTGPVGDHTILLKRDQPLLFRAWGRKAPAGDWPAGTYVTTVSLTRDGDVVDRERVAAQLP